MSQPNSFWPNAARLAVTVSMQFEAGGQPISGAGGPITEPILQGYPDLGQNSFYEYGAREGVPRILDLMDKHDIKMSSFMIGDAVRRHPQVAAEIVRRGHEAGAHGRSWQRQYHLDRDAEKVWIADSVQAIEEVTGFRPVGYNNYWIRPSINTLEILQELGFTYHIDDLSADEPFLQRINGQPFATVPYSVHLNDIASFDFPGFSPADYEQQLVDEFDQLYEEGAHRRRMMVIGLHERLSGHASRVRVLDRVLTRLREHDDVWWARKDEIASWTLANPDTAAWVDRDPAPISGLPGRSGDGR
ncbi:polysaccharide deacetylase family protein [Mycobacterium shinjukuense]|uniref:Polysaccharide deacetylase n=1 Tax=Mycobacterium shinjukuense TaxID=398694 RepID=A0A7I7MSA9_9MYCO|nr:polysaccharide deacetylase family protein [Mycobacterium shinjukuense]MCV6985556.1 polysaccharide deacetylase family protein [Mycobacterium shinjukuense]ORB68148.1 polysaccharide deacetylase [Mycobacterium shinjukuense]BBX74463.1 polysaccharide deacetylase [Mycobacterium shinjukuense]